MSASGDDGRAHGDHGGGGGNNFFRRGSRRGGWDTSSTTPTPDRGRSDGGTGGGSFTERRSGAFGGGNYGRVSGGSSTERKSGDYATGYGSSGFSGGNLRESGDFRRSGIYSDGGNHGGWRAGEGVRYGGGRGYAGGSYGGGGDVPSSPRGLTTLTLGDWESVRSTMADEAVRKLSLSPSSSSSKKGLEPPTRPGFGNVGLRCMVKANHFLVQLVGQGKFYRYSVSFEPAAPKKLNKDIMLALINTYKNSDLGCLTPVYDGRRILLTTKELPFISKEFTVRLDDQGSTSAREREFKVTIRWSSTVECHHLNQLLAAHQLEPHQDMIHLLDAVLKSAENLKNYTPVARSLFSSSMGRGPLSNGLEFWKGFYQSLRPTQMGLSLNIAASARAFYEPIAVTEYLSKILWGGLPRDNKALTAHDRLKAEKALKGVTVVVSHREDRRRYKVLGLSTDPCNQLAFSSPSGEQPIPLYFYHKYNITLRYPSLPCLEVSNGKHLINLPMEVCNIVEGQRFSNKLSEGQVKALLKATALRPYERADQLKKTVEQNNYNKDQLIKEFGLHVNNDFTLVEARVLPPPKLLYDGTEPQAIVDPSMGQWKMSNQRLHEPVTVRFWACVNFSPNVRDASAEVFCDKLLNECSRKGMTFAVRPLIRTSSRDPRQLEKVLHDIHIESGQQLQLLIILLPHAAAYYGKIKQICETELGIVSQCCKSEKVLHPGAAYLEHVALKINVKVGGRNVVLLDAANRHIPLVTDDPTIIFGADVTHPQSGEAFSPSIAAVVASMDWPYFAKYHGLVSVQPPRQEIIVDLSKTVKKLLLAFKQNNGVLPRRIIFYRDGVSEDEFSSVLLREMCAIREACQSLEEEDYLPPVTFIVVQKRHHTRFFPEDPNLADRSQNILAGTVVDTKICHPSQFDFYLCSHAGIKGTSRPAHYHVLYDENNFTPDLLQLFTNSLCYTFARCTRSVSIVPPAYYAHLAAFRARKYIEGEVCETGSLTGSAGTTLFPGVRPLPEIKENLKSVMFYC
ncbi:hypothetical protein RND81_09G100200 [Saponaria officinalis]|uniref:Uncharacterized protein n=1 Tax=Saponaria officinalis TaxID=3572 RepID=A0AAW1IIU7_SAPOF